MAGSIAVGRWQRECWEAMVGEGCANPIPRLRGRAAPYRQRYQHSLSNLITRAQAAGFTVYGQYGPQGGMETAVYVARESRR